MRDVTALKQVKIIAFHNFGKTEIFHRLCTFSWTGTTSLPIPPNSGKKQCYLQEHQPKTLWNLHQKLSRFVSCGPFSEAQLKKAHSAPDVHD